MHPATSKASAAKEFCALPQALPRARHTASISDSDAPGNLIDGITGTVHYINKATLNRRTSGCTGGSTCFTSGDSFKTEYHGTPTINIDNPYYPSIQGTIAIDWSVKKEFNGAILNDGTSDATKITYDISFSTDSCIYKASYIIPIPSDTPGAD